MPLQLPDIINIDFVDYIGNPLRIENILIGIQTFATYKNNIDCSPFLTDTNGHITITKKDIQDRAKNFVQYGLMDYSTLESAKPGIEIYLWGNIAIDKYIDYRKKNLARGNAGLVINQFGNSGKMLFTPSKELEDRIREELNIFETCFNSTLYQPNDVILVKDTWDIKGNARHYQVRLPTW